MEKIKFLALGGKRIHLSKHKSMFKYRKRGSTMLISVSPNVVFLQNLCFGVEMMLTLRSLL